MNFETMKEVWSQSKYFFERGVEGFHDISDAKNEAVVQCNLARLHRLAAQAHTCEMESCGGQFTSEMRHHLKAVSGYIIMHFPWEIWFSLLKIHSLQQP